MDRVWVGPWRLEPSPGGYRIERGRPQRSALTPRPLAPIVRPGPFFGRSADVEAVRSMLAPKVLVQVSGPPGSGVSSVLRAAVTGRAGRPTVLVRLGRTGPGDALQAVADQFFALDAAARPSAAQLAPALAGLDATVVLDDVRGPTSAVRDLQAAMPSARFLVGATTPLVGASVVRLTGLGEAPSLELLEHDLGRRVHVAERAAAWELVRGVEGDPRLLRQAASLFRITSSPVGAACASPEALVEVLDPGSRQVLAAMTHAAGAHLPPDLVTAMAGVTDARDAIGTLVGLGLAQPSGPDTYGVPVGEAVRLRPLVRGFASSGRAAQALADWVERHGVAGLQASDRGCGELTEAALSVTAAAADDAEWVSVARLVRAMEPVLLGCGRLSAADDLLQRGLVAAGHLGDLVLRAHLQHQAGTLLVVGGHSGHALLSDAAALRDRLGQPGAADLSRHNLSFSPRSAPSPVLVPSGHPPPAPAAPTPTAPAPTAPVAPAAIPPIPALPPLREDSSRPGVQTSSRKASLSPPDVAPSRSPEGLSRLSDEKSSGQTPTAAGPRNLFAGVGGWARPGKTSRAEGLTRPAAPGPDETGAGAGAEEDAADAGPSPAKRRRKVGRVAAAVLVGLVAGGVGQTVRATDDPASPAAAPSPAATISSTQRAAARPGAPAPAITSSAPAPVPLNPTLSVSPGVVAFGSVEVGAEDGSGDPVAGTARVRLGNSGGGELRIGSVTVTGAEGGRFSARGCEDRTLAAGQTCTVRLRLVPTRTGATTARLRITTDLDEAGTTIRLRGTGR